MQYGKRRSACNPICRLKSQVKTSSPNPNSRVPRRSFLKGVGIAGVALSAGALLPAVLTPNGELQHNQG